MNYVPDASFLGAVYKVRFSWSIIYILVEIGIAKGSHLRHVKLARLLVGRYFKSFKHAQERRATRYM